MLLEQTQEGSPCVLTVHCSPDSATTIGSLLVVSEARTMEVYDEMGEYCGTVRGETDDGIQPDRYVVTVPSGIKASGNILSWTCPRHLQ